MRNIERLDTRCQWFREISDHRRTPSRFYQGDKDHACAAQKKLVSTVCDRGSYGMSILALSALKDLNSSAKFE